MNRHAPNRVTYAVSVSVPLCLCLARARALSQDRYANTHAAAGGRGALDPELAFCCETCVAKDASQGFIKVSCSLYVQRLYVRGSILSTLGCPLLLWSTEYPFLKLSNSRIPHTANIQIFWFKTC